jgi:hypothetical protein
MSADEPTTHLNWKPRQLLAHAAAGAFQFLLVLKHRN